MVGSFEIGIEDLLSSDLPWTPLTDINEFDNPPSQTAPSVTTEGPAAFREIPIGNINDEIPVQGVQGETEQPNEPTNPVPGLFYLNKLLGRKLILRFSVSTTLLKFFSFACRYPGSEGL